MMSSHHIFNYHIIYLAFYFQHIEHFMPESILQIFGIGH